MEGTGGSNGCSACDTKQTGWGIASGLRTSSSAALCAGGGGIRIRRRGRPLLRIRRRLRHVLLLGIRHGVGLLCRTLWGGGGACASAGAAGLSSASAGASGMSSSWGAGTGSVAGTASAGADSSDPWSRGLKLKLSSVPRGDPAAAPSARTSEGITGTLFISSVTLSGSTVSMRDQWPAGANGMNSARPGPPALRWITVPRRSVTLRSGWITISHRFAA